MFHFQNCFKALEKIKMLTPCLQTTKITQQREMMKKKSKNNFNIQRTLNSPLLQSIHTFVAVKNLHKF